VVLRLGSKISPNILMLTIAFSPRTIFSATEPY